jgi:hypothetical protein
MFQSRVLGRGVFLIDAESADSNGLLWSLMDNDLSADMRRDVRAQVRRAYAEQATITHCKQFTGIDPAADGFLRYA